MLYLRLPEGIIRSRNGGEVVRKVSILIIIIKRKDRIIIIRRGRRIN